jgi:hypothetical protein
LFAVNAEGWLTRKKHEGHERDSDALDEARPNVTGESSNVFGTSWKTRRLWHGE